SRSSASVAPASCRLPWVRPAASSFVSSSIPKSKEMSACDGSSSSGPLTVDSLAESLLLRIVLHLLHELPRQHGPAIINDLLKPAQGGGSARRHQLLLDGLADGAPQG